MACRLSFEDRIFGVLSVSVPREYAQNPEELNIFSELANELAFALHKIKLDQGLKLHGEKLNAAMQLGNLAWWEMEMPSGKVSCDARKLEMLERIRMHTVMFIIQPSPNCSTLMIMNPR